MKRITRYSYLAIITLVCSLLVTIEALAVPGLPSSFYGSVKVNNANAADGTLIQALIGGQVYAEGFTQTYQGESVYSLDVRGDDTDTAAQDGGREGDTIQFKIGGALADQTGVWHSGLNTTLNLTTSASGPVATPEATHTPLPTQTAIVPAPTAQATHTPIPSKTATGIVPPTALPTGSGQASVTPATIVQPSQAATQPGQASPVSSTQTQPGQTSVPSEIETEKGSNNKTTVEIFFIVLIVAIVAGYYFLVMRKKMM
jgi:hypothetical protein